MILPLDGPSRPPLSGALGSVVVLLHGYGADGHDLIGLADAWRADLPDMLFLAPDAPGRIAERFAGRQWFPLARRNEREYLEGVGAARPLLDGYLDAVLAETGVPAARMALFGFSQGAMMALHVGLRRAATPAALLAYSGVLAGPDQLATEIRCRPPVLLVHGEEDDVIPVQEMRESLAALMAANVPVSAHPIPDLGHGIDPEGLDLGVEMLRQALAV